MLNFFIFFIKFDETSYERTEIYETQQEKHTQPMERDNPKQLESVGQTVAVAMETKNGDLKKKLDSFHQTS